MQACASSRDRKPGRPAVGEAVRGSYAGAIAARDELELGAKRSRLVHDGLGDGCPRAGVLTLDRHKRSSEPRSNGSREDTRLARLSKPPPRRAADEERGGRGAP